MRVVVDTNVLVSGLLSSAGPPARIVNAVLSGQLVPVMSETTFVELEAVLRRPRLQAYFARAAVNLDAFLTDLRKVAAFVKTVESTEKIRDEGDRPFLDLMGSRPAPEFLITGDKDFANERYQGVPVISASLFVAVILQKP